MYLVHYWAVALLVPGLAVVAWSLRRRGYGRAQAVGVAALRTATLLVAVGILADVHVRGRSVTRHHVFAVDVSDSFWPNLPAAEELVCDAVGRIGAGDRVSVVAFAREAVVTWEGAGGARPQTVVPRENLPPADATDFGKLFLAVATLVHPGEAGIVYLLTDGIGTSGSSPDESLWGLRSRGGISVNPLMTRPGYPADVRLLTLSAPSRVGLEQDFYVEATAYCESSVRVKVRLTGPSFDAEKELELLAGVPATVSFQVRASQPGLAEYEAAVTGTPDPVTANDRLRSAVTVPGKPVLLVIVPPDDAAQTLLSDMPQFRVRVLTLSAGQPLRLAPAEMLETAAVVLSDVPASAVTPAAMETLGRFVAEMGGGLVMLGGPQSFGAGGWIDTPVEAALPVWCDPRDARKNPLALVLVLDSSGSMAEGAPTKMDLAKRAGLNVVAALKSEDRVAVIRFSVRPEALVPLGPPAPIDPIRAAILSMSPQGGTNMYPALLDAARVLSAAPQKLRHVLILSDGKSLPGNPEEVAQALRSAETTLSAVLTGDLSQQDILERLATESGGRFHKVTEMGQLPRVFLDDLRRVEGPLVRRGRFAVEAAAPLPFSPADEVGPPGAVAAYNRVRPKETATVLWQTSPEPDRTEPLLVSGRCGLGRSAALLTAPGSDWAGELNRWPGTTPLVRGLVQSTARSVENPDYDLSVRSAPGQLVLRVDAQQAETFINFKRLAVHVQAAGSEARTVSLSQTAPGRYEGTTQSAPQSVYALTLEDEATGQVLAGRAAATGYSEEYRRFVPESGALSRWAELTGGRVIADRSELSSLATAAPRTWRSLTWPLLLVFLGLFATEAILRALGRV